MSTISDDSNYLEGKHTLTDCYLCVIILGEAPPPSKTPSRKPRIFMRLHTLAFRAFAEPGDEPGDRRTW
jgi:hypothetical protein